MMSRAPQVEYQAAFSFLPDRSHTPAVMYSIWRLFSTAQDSCSVISTLFLIWLKSHAQAILSHSERVTTFILLSVRALS